MKNARTPTQFTAADGTECLRVPLAGNRGDAIIEAEDWPRLQAARISTLWSLDTNGGTRRYVRAKRSGDNRSVGIARLVTGASRKQHVCYRDGNPLNLRRGNLYLIAGYAKTNFAALVERAKGDSKCLSQTFARASTTEGDHNSPRGYRPVYAARTVLKLGARS
jgi:hypothetical protein